MASKTHYCNADDWLLAASTLEPGDVVVIHPIGHLTMRIVIEAMGKQLNKDPGYKLIDHGNKFFIQRYAPHPIFERAP